MLIADTIHKTYRKHRVAVPVLTGASLAVHPGEFVSVVGASGSGKSTFLHLLGCLDVPDAGIVSLDGQRIDHLTGRDRDRLRNTTFGYVFQFYHLLPELSALDNVLMPAYIAEGVLSWWGKRAAWRKRAMGLLERVGLGQRWRHKPREMSGGEMQRAAIARSLLMNPRFLLADEPTGNLDSETGDTIVKLLRTLNRDEKVTVVMVTHNLELARGTDRVVRMQGGKTTEEARPAGPKFLSLVG
ncbi:MAG: ABC transporter ATP-binding protein [Fimbriiglobus sp.]|jgi:lipoprotein-releasing system ATP-binding protein|nr:ABC transporter ATP-binding protein [Fimbriiglobus sp.]